MPERPLYQEADIAELPDGGNACLWYDKFCNQWTIPDSVSQVQAPELDKEGWIATVTKRPCGDREELKQYAERQQNLIRALNGQCIYMQTISPFVTGLGREHPIENGFLWHHTLGVPYLPGSSIKGMVGAWAEHWQGEKQKRQSILGSQQQVGQVAFLDALPLKPVGLKADVMTPHYTDYYQKGAPPGDWISPVPIPFLVVGERTTFHFAIVPRRQSDEAREHCKTVCAWLQEALEWIGIGAKTAVGYGRFRLCKTSTTPSPQQVPPKPLYTGTRVKPGDRVQAELVEEKTRKGGWKAKHLESGLQGPIQDTIDVPADAKPGQHFELTVASVSSKEMAFKWVTSS